MANYATKRIHSVETEESLISRIRLRDQDAMAEIYDRFSSIVYSVVLRILGKRSGAEQVMQEVLLHIWQNPDAYNLQCGSLCAALALVARNRAVDTLRQRTLKDRTADVVPACRLSFGDLSESSYALPRLRRAMKSLPAKQRRVLDLAFFDGLTPIEIAASTGDPISAVKTCIRDALLSLRNAMNTSGDDITAG